MLDRWYYDLDGARRKGPVSLDELKARIVAGTVQKTSKVWREGQTGTLTAGAIQNGFLTPTDPAMAWLVPVGRSGWAVAAGYCGLLSMIPVVHLAALLFAGLGIRQLQRQPELRGWGRIALGLVGGVIFTVLYTIAFVG